MVLLGFFLQGTEDPSHQGILPRAIADLFEHIDRLDEEAKVAIMVTFLEIYNEEIHDLLHPDIAAKVKSTACQLTWASVSSYRTCACVVFRISTFGKMLTV